MRQQRTESADLILRQPTSWDLSSEELQTAGCFLLHLNETLADATTEDALIEKTTEVMLATFDPIALFLAVSKPDPTSRCFLYSKTRLTEPNEKKVTDFLRGVLASGIDSVSVELFETFPFLLGIPRILAKSPAVFVHRILILVFGINGLTSELATHLLHSAERMLRLRIENARLKETLERRVANLASLHKSAAGMSRQLLNLSELLQTITGEARRVLNVSAAAVLMPDETKTSFTVKAQNGFSSSRIPLPNALFARAFDDFELSGRKGALYHGAHNETFLLVPLVQRGGISGALLFYSNDPGSHLTEDLMQIAEIFGDWVSIATENAVMFERVSGSQRDWENTFDSISDPIYIVDSDYKLKKMNKSLAAFAMKNIRLPIDRNCYRYLFHRNTICPWCPVPRGMQTGQAIMVEAPVFAGGLWQMQSFPYTDKSGKRIGSINVLRDITVLKRMQEQLIESEKLASIGKLISGVAHEVRNPLFGISTTARALANELGNKEELNPFLDIITSETARMNRLMEELLNYSRPVQIDKNPSNLVEIVNEVIEHFKHVSTAQDLTINLDHSDNIPPINVDSNKIKQVLLNLIENGIQHARGAPHIDLFIEYLSLTIPPEIHLVVKDNGTGISRENLARIFDPFFTTRQKGTGLGLSIVRKVVHDHGGRIAIESHVGVGTTFRISLPVVEACE